ncbi:MAG: YcxB family protein [Ruminococcaceae bacterium]|nr:YcxB family protein [Oscillospiraceae bacterium]
MNFKFNINLNDNDYLDYNTFLMFKSPYGRKQILKFRIFISVLFLPLCLIYLYGGEFSVRSFIGVIPYLIVFALVQLLFKTFFVWILKENMKALKKKGKMGYSPVADMEFYEESFSETTPESKTEQKYSAIERVSVYADKVVYIHVNNVMSYILPISCFGSKEQYEEFLGFIKTKCTKVDTY